MALNYVEVMDRFKQKMGLKSDSDVCRLFDISTAALSDRKKRGAIPFDFIIEYCLKNGISTDYILTGKSEELTGSVIYDCDLSNIDESKMIAIPYIENLDEIHHIVPNTDYMVGTKPNMIVLSRSEHELLSKMDNKLYAIPHHDDSMDDTICNGAMMFVDFTDKGSKSGRVYLISMNGENMIKRLFRDPVDENYTMLLSDNRKFPEMRVDNSNFEVLGKVVLSFDRPKIV
jgi:hypothetical protein